MTDDRKTDDYYEVLQLSPSADQEMIERVYRLLAKRYHPDNSVTGNVERFNQLREAFTVLSDPELRPAYDVQYEELRGRLWQVFDQDSATNSFEGDKRMFDGLMSLLYVQRRRSVEHAGLGLIELERMLGCPAEHLDFHVWYLKQKGWIERLENGHLALTVEGVDQVVSGDLMLKRDRLLTGESAAPDDEQQPAAEETEEPAQLDEASVKDSAARPSP